MNQIALLLFDFRCVAFRSSFGNSIVHYAKLIAEWKRLHSKIFGDAKNAEDFLSAFSVLCSRPLRTLKIPAFRKFEGSRVMCEFDKKTRKL